jgi:hypothetical protein
MEAAFAVLRRGVLVALAGLLAACGCGYFQGPRFPRPDPPLYERPAKTINLEAQVQQ